MGKTHLKIFNVYEIYCRPSVRIHAEYLIVSFHLIYNLGFPLTKGDAFKIGDIAL